MMAEHMPGCSAQLCSALIPIYMDEAPCNMPEQADCHGPLGDHNFRPSVGDCELCRLQAIEAEYNQLAADYSATSDENERLRAEVEKYQQILSLSVSGEHSALVAVEKLRDWRWRATAELKRAKQIALKHDYTAFAATLDAFISEAEEKPDG
jgi:hypothetical protein